MEPSFKHLQNPLVSIVIPCRNEEKYIEACINSILNADFPGEMTEIIVADGMSVDDTPLILARLADSHANVSYLKNENKTTPFGLNQGIRASTAEIVIILGAHSEIYPDFIGKCVELLETNKEAACVGGVIENMYDDAVSETISMAMSSPFGVGSAHFRTGTKEGEVDTVAFGAYRKNIFQEVGLFDEELIRNQDDELNFRITQAGHKIVLSKEIKSKYYVRATLSKLRRQYYQYGYWKVYVNKKHGTVTTMRQLAPFMLVVFFLSVFALVFINELYLQIGLAVLVLYLLAGMYSAVRRTFNPLKIVLIMSSYVVLHFSYGWGYMIGILYFILGNRKVKSK